MIKGSETVSSTSCPNGDSLKRYFRLPLYSGVILHELHLANMIVIKRKWDLGIKTKVKSILAMIKECQESLDEALEVLKNEGTSPAGDKLLNLVTTSKKEFLHWVDRNKIDLTAIKSMRNEEN